MKGNVKGLASGMRGVLILNIIGLGGLLFLVNESDLTALVGTSRSEFMMNGLVSIGVQFVVYFRARSLLGDEAKGRSVDPKVERSNETELGTPTLTVSRSSPSNQGAESTENRSAMETMKMPDSEPQRAIDEDAIYRRIGEELESGNKDLAAWTRAYAEASGDEARTRARYIELRARRLIAEQEGRSRARNRDIEYFVKMLNDDPSTDEVEGFFSGMSPREIRRLINSPDALGEYPIHISLNNGRTDLTEWLLEAGANPRAQNYWEKTPMDIAERNEDDAAISLLKKYTL